MYVVHGRIVAAVMRTAAQGVVSNFKRGGSVALHSLTPQERALAQAVIDRFSSAGAPLTLAGVDLMNDRGRPVVNEVEDVVGSRQLLSDQRYRHRFAVFGRFKRYCSKCPMTERHWRVIIISVNRLFRGGETVVTL